MAKLSSGIVGLPNVGKSTLFNALTRLQAPASNYPFCTIDPNVGVVEVPDPRLEVLSQISKSGRIIYATMEFVDIAGLVRGASKGEGLGNQFLANIRETDAIVHVVRCFEASGVVHVEGGVDPIRDIEIINVELTLADLQMAENAISRVAKQAKADKGAQILLALLEKIRGHLNLGKPVASLDLCDEEKLLLKPYPFLTAKKVLYAANVCETDLPAMDNEYVQRVRKYALENKSSVVPFCAKVEEEIAQLDPCDRDTFLQSMGLEQTGLQRLIRAAFDLLGLMTFLTTGELETRAWTISRGTKAPQAAGKIHGDLEKGFIRAEVISYEDFVKYKGYSGARQAGKIRAEGKDYLLQDGEVVTFLHS